MIHHPATSLPVPPSAGWSICIERLRTTAFLVLLALFALALFPKTTLAVAPQKFVLSQPVLSNQDGMITVNLSLTVDSEDGLHDLLKDGAILELSIDLSLERNRLLWANAKEAEITYTSFVRHDPLTRDFIITLPGKENGKELRGKNITRLLHASWRKLALPLYPLQSLDANSPDDQYTVTISTALNHAAVPPWLEKSVIFWSSEVVPSEKQTIEFTLPLK